MSEPNYQERNSNADSKLDDAKTELEKALSDEALSHETKTAVLTAVRHVTEAQSYLGGG